MSEVGIFLLLAGLVWIIRENLKTRRKPSSPSIPTSSSTSTPRKSPPGKPLPISTAPKTKPRTSETPRVSGSSSYGSIVAVDFETTGVKWPYHAVEVAWIVLDRNLREISRTSSLIRPPCPIPLDATRIHGISNEMVKDSPSLDEFIMEEHGNPFGRDHICFVAHSATYDFKLFSPYCKSATLLCTLIASRRAFPNLPNHRLSTLTEHLGIDHKESHRALGDVVATVDVLRKIKEGLDMSGDDLFAQIEERSGYTTMPFGKFKGHPIEIVPSNYLRWLVGRLDHDDQLRLSIERRLNQRPD